METDNAESTADTAISISEEEKDKTTKLAIARYEMQRNMAAMGMYSEIVELPPTIEGLPDEYVSEYAKFRVDVIIKNLEDYIDKHTNPIMAPSISQFSAFS